VLQDGSEMILIQMCCNVYHVLQLQGQPIRGLAKGRNVESSMFFTVTSPDI